MKLLIVEDNPEIIEAVSFCFELRWPEVSVVSTETGNKGVELAETESPDLIILDLGLPDINGFEVLRQIRLFSDVPVIILTVRSENMDKIKGLEMGADDFVVKPFSHMELLARVKAVLRRSQMPELRGEEKPFNNGRIRIDFTSREITVNNNPVKLTPIEYNLLYQMVRNEGRVLTHRFLLEKVWGEEYVDATDYLKKYIQRLRQKLEDDAESPSLILTERGVGYKLIKIA
ncbi:MAG: response regulator transcription factor [Chloroflexi bacterium]|jgi:DNA-binding response OmpR family regulator|nr:response regulator transcription factor [Chloroflexota bacterium]MBT7081772.1 response regulator transcription factor [Chloroflexota bacterium]MBT7289412.1 response regulator transcription factor [Chloroflexota bacterium]